MKTAIKQQITEDSAKSAAGTFSLELCKEGRRQTKGMNLGERKQEIRSVLHCHRSPSSETLWRRDRSLNNANIAEQEDKVTYICVERELLHGQTSRRIMNESEATRGI